MSIDRWTTTTDQTLIKSVVNHTTLSGAHLCKTPWRALLTDGSLTGRAELVEPKKDEQGRNTKKCRRKRRKEKPVLIVGTQKNTRRCCQLRNSCRLLWLALPRWFIASWSSSIIHYRSGPTPKRSPKWGSVSRRDVSRWKFHRDN